MVNMIWVVLLWMIVFNRLVLKALKMTQWNLRSKRKTTGGILNKSSKKNRHQRGRDFMPAHVGETRTREIRSRGGNKKMFMLAANIANVSAGGIIKKAKILNVLENPADSQFVRRNIITKGAIIETDLGKAKVTSRPGQNGVVNAVIVEEKPTQK